jgi:hypothetical protein
MVHLKKSKKDKKGNQEKLLTSMKINYKEDNCSSHRIRVELIALGCVW